jgi:tetratricopeptide (TPR) repeat protein
MPASFFARLGESFPAPGASGLSARALLGWMDRGEAARFLMEDCIFSTPLTCGVAEEIWESHKAVAESLPREESISPKKLPLSAADLNAVRKFRKKHSDEDAVVDFVRLNPMDLVIHQLWVSTEISDRYRESVTPDKWLHTALLNPPTDTRLKWRRETDTILIDLPHAEFFLAGPLQPSGQMRVSEARGFITVAFHANRALLLSGYHLTFACAQRVLEAVDAPRGVLFGVSNQLESMGSMADEVLRTMEGPRPPRMADLFDDRLFVAVKLRRRRHQMRIHFEVAAIDCEEDQTAAGRSPLIVPPAFAQTSGRGIAAESDVTSENRKQGGVAKSPDRKLDGFRDVQAIFDDALRHHQAGRIDHAVASYKRAIFVKPDYADAHSNLGIALLAQGRVVDAMTHSERALVLNPDHAVAHNTLGIALATQGRIDDAIAHYERALLIKSDYADAHINLGSACEAQGKFDHAEAHYPLGLARIRRKR